MQGANTMHKRNYYKKCQQFVEKMDLSDTEIPHLLDQMLLRVAIETIDRHYNIRMPLETLFDYLKLHLKTGINYNKDQLKYLDQIDLIKLIKGKA